MANFRYIMEMKFYNCIQFYENHFSWFLMGKMDFLSGVRQKSKLVFVYRLSRFSTESDRFQITNRYELLQFSLFLGPITSIYNNLEKTVEKPGFLYVRP